MEQRRYARDDSRPPASLKRGDWDPEYSEHEWDRSRRPIDWEGGRSDNWEANPDLQKHMSEEEWRHYNRGVMDGWSADERRRWQNEWRDRSRPRSSTSHNRDNVVEDVGRKDVPLPARSADSKSSASALSAADAPEIDKKLLKRKSEEPLESPLEIKKACPTAIETVLEDDLSEISDDADEILNRDEEIVESDVKNDDFPAADASATTVKIENSVESPILTPSRAIKEESIDDENIDMDFEEISEDELEEESRVKGIGDALGVDWASLVAESRPRLLPMTSAKRRWEGRNVLINAGISVKLAGDELVKRIIKEHAIENQCDSSKKLTNDVKNEVVTVKIEVKEEIIEAEDESICDNGGGEIEICHPVAAVQVCVREKKAVRKCLFDSVGANCRALSARRDLMIRRHLCELPLTDKYVEVPKGHDPELAKLAVQLFERCL